jgi:GNAT superfamily N-acetyltransferase
MTETSPGAPPHVVTRVFSPKLATAEEWQAFHSYIRLRAAEEDPGEPILSDEVRQRDMRIDWPLFQAHRVLALIDGEIVGSLVMWTRRQGTPDYEAHARHISADAGVRKSRRRQGIGTTLLGELAAFMREHGPVTATLSARVGDGSAFLASIGAVEKHRMVENRLDLSRVDRRMLQVWEARGDQAEGLTWEIHAGRVPIDRYQALIPQLTVMLNSMPLGDLEIPPLRFNLAQIKAWYADMDARGGDHTMVLLNAGTEVVAVSEAAWALEFPDRVFQNLTAVAPAWRGRGLAKAVKARLLRAVCERRPGVRLAVTSNANVNAAMLAINAQLGFVRHRDIRTFQIDRDAIEATLLRPPKH